MRGKHTNRLAKNRKKILLGGGIILAVFLILNLVVFAMYHGRAYPRSTILGQQVSGLDAVKIQRKLEASTPLPYALTLSNGTKQTSATTADLGVSMSIDKVRSSVTQARSWLPLANLFMHHDLPAPIDINDAKLQETAKSFAKTYYQAPSPAHISWDGKAYKVVQPGAGHELDTGKLAASIIKALTASSKTVAVPTRTVAASAKITDSDKALQAIRSQLSTSVTYTYLGKSVQATSADKAAWFVQSGNGFVVSEAGVSSFIKQVGIKLFGTSPYNLASAAASTTRAVKDAKNTSIALTKFSKTVTYNYCTAVKGVSTSYLSGFNQLIAQVYADARGWNLSGQIIFNHVSSDCDFTVWLSSASQMPTFGAICDSTWDCNIGTNVVANFDRWEKATDTWNAAHPGGDIQDYRTLLINHETGHQLGFYDNYTCSSPGALAPVMMQQSIDLHGCKFNPWPLASEKSAVRSMHGL